jgi:hypothetical protein
LGKVEDLHRGLEQKAGQGLHAAGVLNLKEGASLAPLHRMPVPRAPEEETDREQGDNQRETQADL